MRGFILGVVLTLVVLFGGFFLFLKFGYVNVPYDLSAFKARGGKLLLYHGWNDTAISPENTINYYQNVLQKMGAKQESWMRLYMVPGMNHCSGGPATSNFDAVTPLINGVETGAAPASLPAPRRTPGSSASRRTGRRARAPRSGPWRASPGWPPRPRRSAPDRSRR